MGINRSTFCRFILDLRIADQDRVPFVWAVQAFDKLARPFRLTSIAEEWYDPSETKIPLVPMLSKWDFADLLDAFLRRKYSAENLCSFMEELRATSEARKASDDAEAAAAAASLALVRQRTPPDTKQTA